MSSDEGGGRLARALPLLAIALGLVFILSVGVAVGAVSKPVALATQNDQGCFVANTTGLLIPDATAGTAIVEEDMGKQTAQVVWPTGYTARGNGSQVEVVDRAGHVVARTGQRYELLGGYNDADQWIACDGGVYPPLWPSPR